ncbi:MDR family oxidoreductase [Nitrincola alkalisediminis]|nr:MDR family oxidoreductase [Nitrincola alkalisediminis]
MSSEHFRAFVLDTTEAGLSRGIQTLSRQDLPDGDVLVAIDYSGLNYKDGLAITGTGKIVLTWPMVPGIDFVGRVVESSSDRFKNGDSVICTGWAVGEKYWGGYSQFQRVKSDWLVPLPSSLTARDAMLLGTAGLTAMLCVSALEDGGVLPEQGPVIVTGAAGGVGSIAISLLAQRGYSVTAVTGRLEEEAYLRSLGATDIISRDEMSEPARPLEKQRWAGGIDTVGGNILARILAEAQYGATLAACGLAASHTLPTTVMPFILRNVRLQGIDSVNCPTPTRIAAWTALASNLPSNLEQTLHKTIGLEELELSAHAIINGVVRGRILVNPNL